MVYHACGFVWCLLIAQPSSYLGIAVKHRLTIRPVENPPEFLTDKVNGISFVKHLRYHLTAGNEINK